MKKLIPSVAILLVLSMLLSITAFAGNTEKKLNYLLIGDSIARGAGVLNPDEACYGLMVANTNGYNYKNDAIDGSRSEDLLKLLDREDVAQDIKNADIISISIGGNDFLRANLITLLIEKEILGKTDRFTDIQALFYENFCKIIDKIKLLNPDALIIMQTLYNMRHDILKGVNELGKNLLNESYRQYLNEHPGAYILAETGAVLDGRWDCLAADTIHPSGTGNIEIARVILKILKDEGLGSETEPVILIESIEIVDFRFGHLFRVVKYYINYWQTH